MAFTDLTNDLYSEIILHLDAVSSVLFLSTSKNLWEHRRHSKITERITPYQKYIKYKQWNKGLIEAVLNNNFPQVQYFIDKGADDFSNALSATCVTGNIQLFKYFRNLHGLPASEALMNASKGGYQELVEIILSLYPFQTDMMQEALLAASSGGHRNIIQLYMSKMERSKEVLNSVMCGAVEGGHKNLMKEYIELGADDWKSALLCAALGGHKDLTEYFWNKGNFNQYEVDLVMCLAAKQGHMEVVEWSIEKGANNWNDGLRYAAEGGKTEMVNFFRSKGAENIEPAISAALKNGHLEVLKQFQYTYDNGALLEPSRRDHREVIEHVLNNGAEFFNLALYTAAMHGQESLVEFYVKKMKIPANSLNVVLDQVVETGNLKMTKCLVQLGANDEYAKALYRAKQKGFQFIVEYLKSAIKYPLV